MRQLIGFILIVGVVGGLIYLATRNAVENKDSADTQSDADKAAITKAVKEALAARHGGRMPETMSAEDTKIAAQAAINWKTKQIATKTKQELEAMKVKPAPSGGAADVYIAKEVIKSALRDPDLAVFGADVFFANDRKMNGYYVPVVCGSVNAKNGFGGMTGQKRFVFFPTLEGRLVLEDSVADAIIVHHWNKMCAGKHG